MPSDLWRYSINAIKSDVNISKLRDYQAKEVKKTIRKKLLTVGTEVFVICNKKMLKKFILETPGLSDVYQKLPYTGMTGHIIEVDTECAHSKIAFKDNKQIWFPITALKLFEPVTLEKISNIQTDDLDLAKRDSRKKSIKTMYDCVKELQRKEKLTRKERVNEYLNRADKSRMNLKEIAILHRERNGKLEKLSDEFTDKIKKIKRNRCFEKMKLPNI